MLLYEGVESYKREGSKFMLELVGQTKTADQVLSFPLPLTVCSRRLTGSLANKWRI